MATRKIANPLKQRVYKNHGPKRHLFKEFKPMTHVIAQAGLLNKYNNYESFTLSCGARGVKVGMEEMWEEFKILPHDKQNEYLKNIKEHALIVEKKKKAEEKK